MNSWGLSSYGSQLDPWSLHMSSPFLVGWVHEYFNSLHFQSVQSCLEQLLHRPNGHPTMHCPESSRMGLVWPKHCVSFHPYMLAFIGAGVKKMHLLTGLPHNGKSVEDNPSGLPIDPTSIVWTSWIQPKKQAKKLSCSVSLGVPTWGGIGLCFTKNVCMYLSPAFTCPFLKIASEFIIWVLLI